MTLRENLEQALRGEPLERIPFALYGGFFNTAAGPELREVESIGDIGIARPWKIEYTSVQVKTEPLADGGDLTTYATPLGELYQRRVPDPGYGSMWVMEHLVKRPEDWRIVRYIIEDTNYVAAPEDFEAADAQVGKRGIAMAPVERMPFQRLWIEFGDLEQLMFALADQRDKLDRMISLMTRKATECWALVAQCSAEFVWAPDNLTADVMSPELYRRYAQPYYEALAEVLHPLHKKIVAHFDGHLAALADLIAETPVDVVESFTPPPNGNLALGDAWRTWSDKVLWVNFPPAGHLHEPKEIKARMKSLVAELPERRRIAFEISEDVPVHRMVANFTAIAEALQEV